MGWPAEGSLLDMAIRNKVKSTLDTHFASPEFKEALAKHVKWSIQGFEPGYGFKEREAFTKTVAKRIRSKAREPVYLFGHRVWRWRLNKKIAAETAEQIVTEFLREENIKFGDPNFYWKDGHDLADEDMSYWEGCP